MAYVILNDQNQITTLFMRAQPGVAGLTEIPDDDPRIVAYQTGQTPAQLIAYANAKQAAVSSGGLSVNVALSGAPIMVEASTDAYSLVLLQGAVSIAQATPAQVFNWVQPSGPVSLSAAEIIALFSAVTLFIQATFTTLGSVISAIGAGSITTPAQIDAAAWPANS